MGPYPSVRGCLRDLHVLDTRENRPDIFGAGAVFRHILYGSNGNSSKMQLTLHSKNFLMHKIFYDMSRIIIL